MSADDGFFYRLHQAEDAGLNQEAALQVAYLEISLEGMDMDDESSMPGDDDDDYDCGCRGLDACEDCFPF